MYYDETTIEAFLPCRTPDAWVEKALANQQILLLDHAHCEKKAASSAMSFMYQKSSEHPELLLKMSQIAREELVHFEQVLRILKKRYIRYRLLSESRYAKGLRSLIRTSQNGRLVDILIVGAFIEARSCERFKQIAPHLDSELSKFYQGLLASEKRHFTVYLNFAKQYAEEDVDPHIARFAALEKSLIQSKDTEFRFHSGV